MSKDETKTLLEMIMRVYPRFKIIGDIKDVDVWHECLEDLDYDKAKIATKNVIKVSEYPPTIAEIRKVYEEITGEEKAVHDTCNYYYNLCRGIYPKEIEEGYGYKEFVDKVMTAKSEKRIMAAQYIYSYMSKVVYSGEEVPDLVEIIKGTK